MARTKYKTKTVDAFAVFDSKGRLLSARDSESQAEEAAKIIGGTEWASRGFTVEPVQVTRFLASGR